MYAFHLDKDFRILSITDERFASLDDIILDSKPQGDFNDYKIINNEFIYDPLPTPIVPPEISITERLNDIESALCEIVDMLS